MSNLMVIESNERQSRRLVIDSREVADMTGKQHAHLLRDIKGYLDILDPNPNLDSAQFFIPSTYYDAQKQERPCYLLTRKGCDMVANKMTGEKGVLFTAYYVSRFEAMEKELQNQFVIPQTLPQALRLAADLAEQLDKQKPLVAFAETCAASQDSVLVRELAKICSKQGINTGEHRLYRRLRAWKMIFPHSTEPYQEYIDRGYFEVTQTAKNTSSGTKLFKTTRVTPKGQMHIINRLKKEAVS
jgi:Rha family phage regulatory protein